MERLEPSLELSLAAGCVENFWIKYSSEYYSLNWKLQEISFNYVCSLRITEKLKHYESFEKALIKAWNVQLPYSS